MSLRVPAPERTSVMAQPSTLLNPLDAHYTGHREAEQRRRETREWLSRRERELGFVKDAPPTVPASDKHS
jgi:hypothetical protein